MIRAWRMPVIAAVVWALLYPLTAAVLVFGIYGAVVRRQTERTDLALAIAVLVVWLLCLVAAGRSLAARIVVDPQGLAVHNTLGTVRVPWSELDGIETILAVNSQALVNWLWYGVGVRVRGRRRQVRILASWYRREDQAQELAERLRSLATAAGGVDRR